ncbi:hypothetical protein H8E52_10405 [bacterium]|nr:hypothetical protein [bacterium]
MIRKMRAIWGVMRPDYQEEMGDRHEHQEATALMQGQVVKKIEEMGGN